MNTEIFAVTRWVVALGVVINILVGFLWYGPLFGDRWMRAAKLTQEDLKMGPGLWIDSIVSSIISSYGIGIALNAVDPASLGGALLTALVLWLAFTASPAHNHLMFEGKPTSLFMINASHDLAVFLIMALLFFYLG